MEYLEQLDRKLFLFFNGLHHPSLDSFMYLLSHKYFWIPLYLLFVYLFIKKYKQKSWLPILMVFVTFTATDLTSTHLFKKRIKRYRPSHNLEIKSQVHNVKKFNGKIYRGGKYGFVSSHACNTFGLATLLSLSLFYDRKKWIPWLFFWAALVSYTRIYLGVHYPSDLICGGLLGMMIAYLFYQLSKTIQNKWLL